MAFGLSIPDIAGPQDSGYSLSPELLAQVRQMMAAPDTGSTPASGQPAPTPLSLASAARPQPAGGSIQDRFVSTLRDGGLTNPNGLGAVAAYAQRESGYSPSNINGSWSDPSQSGAPGTSGGILSWRGDRLDAMRQYTAGAADPVTAQAKFLLQENPALTRGLQNAGSPEEANRLMADAWKFAGYNQPGGSEFGARLAATRNFAGQIGGGRTMQMPGGSNAPAAFSLGGITQSGGAGTSLPFGGGMAGVPEAAAPSTGAGAPAPDQAGALGQGAAAKSGQKQGGASPMQIRAVRPRPFGFMAPMQFAGQAPARQG